MHKHHDMIVAWAKGATIQRYIKTIRQWRDCGSTLLDWDPGTAYRIKPEPKPDVYRYGVASKDKVSFVGPCNGNPANNVMFVFDGETGVLKATEVLNEN